MPEIQKELDGRYKDKNVQAFGISYGDPDWYLREFKASLKVTFPWLLMDVRLPNPYYRELYDQWELVENHPTLVLLDTNGIVRSRGQGLGDTDDPGDINYRGTFDMIGELLAEVGPKVGWHVGELAPDFTLKDIIKGETYTLSEQLGKPILLTFWGTGCIECGDLIPGVYAQEVQTMYGGPDKLTTLGVDSHTPLDFLKTYIEEMRIEYPVLVDPAGAVFNRYKVGDEFIFLVIDPGGFIRYRGMELDDDIFEVLDELLGPPSEEDPS